MSITHYCDSHGKVIGEHDCRAMSEPETAAGRALREAIDYMPAHTVSERARRDRWEAALADSAIERTRLRDALKFDAIPTLLIFADGNAGVQAVIAKLRAAAESEVE